MTAVSRRRLLAGVLLAAGASACGPVLEIADDEPTPSPPQSGRGGGPAPAATDGGGPRFQPYEPLAGDVFPNAKRLAGRFVQMLTTYEPGQKPRDVVGEAALRKAPGFDLAAATRAARPLLIRGAASKGEIVYPQMGGLQPHGDPSSACVMVVVRQHLVGDDGEPRQVSRTVDVRLSVVDGQWRLGELASAGGEHVRRPRDLSRAAARVLDDRRIDLPDSARWDIHRGDIDEQVLVTMSAIADAFPFSVAVLRSGHPVNVFGSSTVSNHTRGLAVDIWAIDGTPVVRQNEGIVYDESAVPKADRARPAFNVTRDLLERYKVPELGSPWNLDPPNQQSFTDPVHQDHVHVAFHQGTA